jgi:NAD(P)-dependent dehydrogenase (short-subunit alcohol dehydrogenase family)
VELNGKVAVVTGAASGIGRALAEVLARRGCSLALADVDAAGLAGSAARVEALGRRATTHVVDVADWERVVAFADEVVAAHGGVDLVVNNAGVSVTGTLEQQSIEDLRWIVGVNFWGVVHGCKAFLPHLRARPEGHLVNVSSVFGLIGLPTQSSYCATKFAVRGFSEALWAELAGSRIGVTVVHPGGVRTNIVRASRTADPDAKARMVEVFDRRMLAPEVVAERIARGVERGVLRVRVCRETYAVDWAKRLFPSAVHHLVRAGYRRFGSLG